VGPSSPGTLQHRLPQDLRPQPQPHPANLTV
jgi:hypothetical protein